MRQSAAIQLLIVLGVLAVLAVRDPNQPGNYPACAFRSLSGGLLCPGCGSTRMLHAVLHGDVATAFGLNPLGLLLLPFLGWWIADLSLGVVRGRRLRPLAFRPWLIWSLLVVVLVYTAARNLLPWLTTA